MSDLISRSALINKIRGIVPGSQDVDFIVGLIDNQPTAFDTERVVEQLEEIRKTALNKVKLPIMIVCKHDLQEFADICFEESIDIVKKGGVE